VKSKNRNQDVNLDPHIIYTRSVIMKLNIVKTESWQIRLQKLFFSIFTSLIVLFCANYSIAADNLLENPGAEDGTTSWTHYYGPSFKAVTEFRCSSAGCYLMQQHSGSKFWYGGDGTENSAVYQDEDVSNHAGAIDGGGVKVFLSGWLSGCSHWAQLAMKFLDGGGNELGSCETGYKSDNGRRPPIWTKYSLEEYLPIGTRTIRVLMQAKHKSGYGEKNEAFFDDLSLTLAVPKLSEVNVPEQLDFGNLYLETETNSSLTDYNRSITEPISFKNSGDEMSKLNWSLDFVADTGCQGEAKFSKSSGSLDKDATQTVTIWLEGFSGNPGDKSGTITLTTGGGNAEIGVSTKAWRITQISHNSPAKGSNDKVNVALNDSVSLVLNSTSTHPDATVVYRWQKRSAGEDPGSGFDQTDGVEKYYSFTDPGGYTIYCKAVEKIGTKEIETDLLEIPVRAWNRPVVKDTPPQDSIDAGDVSWFNGKYAGVESQPVRLMADGSTENTPPDGEYITKYRWSFDPDWDTVELEQPAGEVVSYTWNNPKDDKIRCKAVTNYRIESEEKLFDLKVYNTLEADPGGPYTGRPNTVVKLQGSVDKTSYPGATFEYQWEVNVSVPKNSAIQNSDYVELTPNENSKSGQLEYADLQLSDNWSVTGEFWTGGGNGADAFYIYVWASDTPTSENSAKGQYSINYDEYQDEIQLKYDGDSLTEVAQSSIDNSQWRSFQVDFDQGRFEIYLDDQLKLEHDDSANYQNRMSNNLFGFGARTGGLNNYHRVRNMQWYKGGLPVSDQEVTTDGNGIAEHTWSQDGTYPVKFSAEVTTSEGLVLEDSQLTDVIVESGKPTALPGGPYRGGIAGGSFSPVPFEGNSPDYVEDKDVGHIVDWEWIFGDPNSGQQGLIGKFYEYPNDLADGSTLNLDIVENHVSDNNMAPKATKIFETIEFPSTSGDFKHKDQGEEATGVSNYFLARFTGFIQIETPGDYQFHITSDEGFRLKINDEVVAEHLGLRAVAETSGSCSFTDPGNYPIELSYFERLDNAALELSWTPPNGTKAVVPANRLTTGGTKSGGYNPTHAYVKAGKYTTSLIVQSEYGKWSVIATTDVEVIDGKIAGYVRAADLRTPVREVRLTLTSSHVDRNSLARVAAADDNVNTTDEGGLWTETDTEGYYVFEHLPLGSYRVVASKGSGDSAHEFETKVKATELTLDGPNQLAIDFVDLSVFPVGGQIAYSIQKNGKNVPVKGVQVTAQPVGSTSGIRALPSAKSLSATNTNYSLPLFAGKYLFLAEKEVRDIRIKEDTPGYDSNIGLVTIEDARTDIDFVDYTSYELTVFVEDSGGYAISNVTVEISGENGQAVGETDENDGKFVATLNPGEYTVTVDGAMPKGESEEKPAEVDLTGGNEAVTMVIPSKIEVSFSPRPKLFDAPQEFLDQFGLNPEDNPEGYMYYYPPEPRAHTYTITATSNGHPVEDFTLFVTDDVSMMTDDVAVEQELLVEGEEGEYTITGGYPKKTTDEPPLAAPKTVSFRATKDGYDDSDVVEDEVTVLGDVPEGTAAKIVSVPVVNYTVLHDPPGDGSYAYLNDSMSISGIVAGMTHKINDVEVPVYPSPWSTERKIKDVKFEKDPDSDTEFDDLGEGEGLLGYRNSDPTLGHFSYAAALEVGTGAAVVVLGPFGYILQVVKLGVKAAAITPVTTKTGIVQYEVSPSRSLKTPSGDTLPDLLGPGKGDIYFGEGWTLGLQTKYRLGIECTGRDPEDNCLVWELVTEQVETYDILKRTNQYIYTPRDIENIIVDLDATINDPETTDDDEKTKLKDAKDTWQNLLDWNYAYVWARDYLREDGEHYGESLDDFFTAKHLSTSTNCETLIFSAGPTFEYSRAISESHGVNFSTGISVSSGSSISNRMKTAVGLVWFGTGTKYVWQQGSSAGIGSSTSFGSSWHSGRSTKQTVGFVLHDNDIGDNIATRVKADPRWGTPLFFAEPGSYTSDPWEPGTNKSVDFTMELVDEPTGPFDYHDGAHYKVKLTYEGQRELESKSIGFLLYASAAANTDNLTFRFNGTPGSYGVFLSKGVKSATVLVSVYPPEADMGNSEEKEYPVVIGAKETADSQISSKILRNITFVDLRPPRATVIAPYDGERISPVFFPADNPFEIEVVSEDIDLKSIQLQIRSKQPDGVWEPWRNLSGMLWEDGGANENVTVFDRLDRKPPRREFTFKWAEDDIKTLGVGEYALRAIATDKATSPNVDIDPPSVVFLVDDAKPSVLNSIPDYQARESQRIYRGELSVTFTDDMRATDFSDRTFYVMDLLDNNKKLSGYVSYSPALRKTVFVPIVPFQPNGFYRVEIKTDEDTDSDGDIDERGVHDLAGNPLDNAFMWTFRTTDAPFEPTWSMNWRVTDVTAMDANNIAAVEYGALDEEDESDEKDARAVPGLASQLRMSFLNPNKVRFDRDIRPADGRLSHHWFFEIVNAEDNSTVTIEWQPSVKLTKTTRQYQVIRLIEFDAQGNVSNTISLDPTQAQADPDTGEIEFVTAYTYTNGGETARHFRLDVQKVSFVAEAFEVGTSGWKFFSVPITPQRAEPFVNLGDDIDPFQLYQYDTQLSGYKIYPFDIGEVGLQAGHGYFTRLTTDVNADIGGSSNHDDVTLDLDAAGWYAIGNPFIKEVDVADLKVDDGTVERTFDDAVAAGLVEGTLYQWDIITDSEAYQSENPVSDSYKEVTEVDQLNPWEGYWLKTNQPDLTITIPVPPSMPDTPPPPDHLKPRMAPQSVVSGLNPETTGERVLEKGEFDLRLELTSEFASDVTTTFGTHPNAKLNWDAMDSTEPPILGETVAAYFKRNDWKGRAGLYNRDYQPALQVGESRTWQLTVYTDKPETTMNLSWENALENIPDDIMLSFRRLDVAAGFNPATWQDMRQVHLVELAPSSTMMKHQFEIRVERFEMSPLSDVQVIAGEKQVLLRWKSNDNDFISGYTITRHVAEFARIQGDARIFANSATYSIEPGANQFLDTAVAEEATYTYQVIVHFKSSASLHSETFTVTVLPVIKKTVLLQSYPNPFNPDVWIPYELEKESPVSIEIYNATGQLVRTLELGQQPRGRYISKSKAAYWDGRSEFGERAASGLYFYVLKSGNFVATKKMVILK